MSEDARQGLIGPNAILQMVPVLERAGGPALSGRILDAAGIAELPDGRGMIPEAPAARLHREVRLQLPELAPELTRAAGIATADYILAHRIPAPAQRILRMMPAPLAARMLARAIRAHAWTFAGSGTFRVISPWCFEIEDNPVVRGETASRPLCHWHAAVFERLYQVLVHPACRCVETACAAAGGGVCRFELSRRA